VPPKNTKIIPTAITSSSSNLLTLIQVKPINPKQVLDPKGKDYLETA
jgi:hypothetical protein